MLRKKPTEAKRANVLPFSQAIGERILHMFRYRPRMSYKEIQNRLQRVGIHLANMQLTFILQELVEVKAIMPSLNNREYILWTWNARA